jgi:hypothetical protein
MKASIGNQADQDDSTDDQLDEQRESQPAQVVRPDFEQVGDIDGTGAGRPQDGVGSAKLDENLHEDSEKLPQDLAADHKPNVLGRLRPARLIGVVMMPLMNPMAIMINPSSTAIRNCSRSTSQKWLQQLLYRDRAVPQRFTGRRRLRLRGEHWSGVGIRHVRPTRFATCRPGTTRVVTTRPVTTRVITACP